MAFPGPLENSSGTETVQQIPGSRNSNCQSCGKGLQHSRSDLPVAAAHCSIHTDSTSISSKQIVRPSMQ